MARRSADTRQVNLMLTPSQEQIVRTLVQHLREGGPEYEARLRAFVGEAPAPRYMHVSDLDRRFGAVERRLLALEQKLADAPREPARRRVRTVRKAARGKAPGQTESAASNEVPSAS